MFRTEIIVVVCLIELVFLIKDILGNHQDKKSMKIGKCVGWIIALAVEFFLNHLVQDKNIYWIIYGIMKMAVFFVMWIPLIIILLWYSVKQKIPFLDDKSETSNDEEEALKADRHFMIFGGFWGAQIYFSRFQLIIGIFISVRTILSIFILENFPLYENFMLILVHCIMRLLMNLEREYGLPQLKKWYRLKYIKYINKMSMITPSGEEENTYA